MNTNEVKLVSLGLKYKRLHKEFLKREKENLNTTIYENLMNGIIEEYIETAGDVLEDEFGAYISAFVGDDVDVNSERYMKMFYEYVQEMLEGDLDLDDLAQEEYVNKAGEDSFIEN